MQRLTKNVYNKRIAVFLSNIDKWAKKNVENPLKVYVDRFADITSMFIAGLISLIATESVKKELDVCWLVLIGIFLLVLIVAFLLMKCCLLPAMWRYDYSNLEEDTDTEKAWKFNSKIIQITAEINEEIHLAERIKNKEQCALTLIESLYNLNYVLNYIIKMIETEDTYIRSQTDGSPKYFDKKINLYALRTVIKNIDSAIEKIEKLDKTDYLLELWNDELFQKDYGEIKKKLGGVKEKLQNSSVI